jgi:hypothetical protein
MLRYINFMFALVLWGLAVFSGGVWYATHVINMTTEIAEAPWFCQFSVFEYLIWVGTLLFIGLVMFLDGLALGPTHKLRLLEDRAQEHDQAAA